MVTTATMPIRRAPLPEAPNVLPGLKPNQPKARMNVPRMARIWLWPGMLRIVPSFRYLPIRGPRTTAPASAHQPPIEWTTPDPAKST